MHIGSPHLRDWGRNLNCKFLNCGIEHFIILQSPNPPLLPISNQLQNSKRQYYEKTAAFVNLAPEYTESIQMEKLIAVLRIIHC